MIKKFFTAFFLAVLFLNLSNVTFAKTQEISVVGEYQLGENDTRAIAKKGALDEAKRKIVEQIGIQVESYSEMNNFHLTKDQIKTAARAMLRITQQDYKFYNEGTLCKAFVTAEFDPDRIANSLKDDTSPYTGKSENNAQSEKILRLAGFEEYDNHYYKVFDEGMNWLRAKEYCEDMGGHLVTITSSEEQKFIHSLIRSQGKRNNYWLGGFRSTPSKLDWIQLIVPNDFNWVTDENFSYSNWDKNQPDHEGGKEKVIMIWRSNGFWNDIIYTGEAGKDYGAKNFGFVCEWESFDDIKI